MERTGIIGWLAALGAAGAAANAAAALDEQRRGHEAVDLLAARMATRERRGPPAA